MPKYGWFKTSGAIPSAVYEGDWMQMDKEFVKIYKSEADGGSRMVAAIRLDKGQDVREVQ